MKMSLLDNKLEDYMFEVENIAQVKVVSAIQRLMDHVVIYGMDGLPLDELKEDSKMDGLSWLKQTAPLLDEMSCALEMKKEDETTYLREMNGVSLMLEVAESLECGEDVVHNEETVSITREIPSFEFLEILPT